MRRVLGEIVKALNLKHLNKKKTQQPAEHGSAKWPNATRVKSNTLGGVCLVYVVGMAGSISLGNLYKT